MEEEIASNGCFDIAVWDGVRVKGGMGDGVWFPWQLSMRFLSGEVLSKSRPGNVVYGLDCSMAETRLLHLPLTFRSLLYTSLRHQADTHNRSPSPRPSTLHHSRCAQPPLPTFSFACCAPPACDLSVLMLELSLSPKLWSLKRSLRDLGITGPPRGAFTLLGLDSIYQISL